MKISKLRKLPTRVQKETWIETLEESGLGISSVASKLLPEIQQLTDPSYKKVCLVRITSNDRVRFSNTSELILHIESKGFRRPTPAESCLISSVVSLEQFERAKFDCIIFMHKPLKCNHGAFHNLRLIEVGGKLWLRTLMSTLGSISVLFAKNYGLVFVQE